VILSCLSSLIYLLSISTTNTLKSVQLNFHLIMLTIFSFIECMVGVGTVNSLLYDISVCAVCICTFSMCQSILSSEIDSSDKIIGLSFSSLILVITLACLAEKSNASIETQDIATALWQLSLGLYVLSVTHLYDQTLLDQD
jgi:hypothetical protein